MHRLRNVALAAAPLVLIYAAASAQGRQGGGFLDNLFSRGEPPARSGQAPPNAPPTADAEDSELVVRIGRLENQIRQLTGTIEQLQFRNQQLEQLLKRSQDDAEFRFQQLGVKSAPSSAPVTPRTGVSPGQGGPGQGAPGQIAPAPIAQPPASTGRRSDVFDPAQNPTAPGAPRALGGGNMPVPAEPEIAVGAPGGRAVGAPLDLSNMAGSPQPAADAPGAQVATLPPSQTPKDEFDLAYGYVQRKDYALAEQSFRTFLKKYPDGELTPQAHYWLGEAMFQRRKYQDAADSFLLVVRNYEKSSKAPDALLRLGQSLNGLGQKELACASLGEVERKYPAVSASVKRAVAQEQKRASC